MRKKSVGDRPAGGAFNAPLELLYEFWKEKEKN